MEQSSILSAKFDCPVTQTNKDKETETEAETETKKQKCSQSILGDWLIVKLVIFVIVFVHFVVVVADNVFIRLWKHDGKC